MSRSNPEDRAGARHFLDLSEIPAADLRRILDNSAAIKSVRRKGRRAAEQPLAGKVLAMIFDKPSTRTRVSFDLAMRELGGETVMLTGKEMQLGRGETIADTARVLSRFVDAIVIRVLEHDDLVELARHAAVPVINGLTKRSHPCQVMADVLTFEEHKGPIKGVKVAWSGDSNNVLASWVHAAQRFDFSLAVATPAELELPRGLLDWARRSGARLRSRAIPSRPSRARTPSSPTAGCRWETTTRRSGIICSRPIRSTPSSWPPRPGTRFSCTACPRIAARRSPTKSSTVRNPSSSTRPRTACMRKRAFCPGVSATGLKRGGHERSAAAGPAGLPPRFRPRPRRYGAALSVEQLDVRGRIVRLGASVDRILSQHGYPAPVARVVGEALALTILLGSSLKIEGRFQLQTRSDGAIDMLVVDFDAPDRLRAFARFDAARLAGTAKGADLLGSGHLAFTVDQGGEAARYQGIVALEGQGLEAAAHQYFRQSEQIPTQIRLAVAQSITALGSSWRAGGLIDRSSCRTPASGAGPSISIPATRRPERPCEAAPEDDAWTEAKAITATVEDHELVDPTLSGERLLYRLFHEPGVTVFEPSRCATPVAVPMRASRPCCADFPPRTGPK